MSENIKLTCCFSGHRFLGKAAEELTKKLPKVLEQLIVKRGVINFISGGALGFDLLAAKAVLQAKEKFPALRLILALPCKNQDKLWPQKQKEEYRFLLSKADKLWYARGNYQQGCMHERNRYMVQHAAYCVCYLHKQEGGTFYTVNYAKQKGLFILNLA